MAQPQSRPRRTALALLLALALPSAATAGEYPLLSRAIFWEPYRFDAETAALFHLDDAAKDERLNLDDLLSEGETTPDGDVKLPTTEKSENAAANAVRAGLPATLRGSAALVPEGRFRGSLRLSAADGLLELPPHGPLAGRAIEFWLCLDSLPREDAVLVCCFGESSTDKRPLAPVRLLLKPSGALALDWQGKALPPTAFQCRPREWLHLAFGWSSAWPTEGQVHLLVNGRPEQVLSKVAGMGEANQLGRCTVGNDPLGKSGVTGRVDELRVSRGLRRYCAREWDPARPDRPHPAAYGPPHWREADDLLLLLTFDKSLEPARAPAGLRSPRYQPPGKDEALERTGKHFQRGVHGLALVHGKDGLSPEYAGPGILAPEGGTIAFWLRPLEWDNYTRHNKLSKTPPRHVELFRVTGALGVGSKPGKPESTTRTTTSTSGPAPLLTFTLHLNPSDEAPNPVPFDPGRWTHLAVTWQGAMLRTYVDGRPRGADGTFSIRLHASKPGGLSFKAVPTDAPRTLLDDFRIYRRPLAPAEIANLAALDDPRRELKRLPPAELTIQSNGVLGRIRVEVAPLLVEHRQVKKVRLTVHKQGDSKALGEATVAAPPLGSVQAEIKTPPLEFGDYAVRAELLAADGRALCTAEEPFAFARPPWFGCRAGLSDKVMPGWDPVQAKDGVVSVCLREIHLGPSGLPAKVISAGEDVLAGPIEVVAQQGGKPVELAGEAARITKRTEVRADWAGELRAPEWRLRTQASIEYDGMMWFECTLEPEKGATPELSRLAIRIPYRAHNAELFHGWSGNGNFRDPRVVRIGALPTAEGLVFRSNDREVVSLPPQLRGSFIPYVLLAGDDRGMAYFAENDRGWTPSSDVAAVAIERQGDAVTLVLHIICQPVRLDGPRRFAFGLHPIPAKRLPTYWRRHADWTVCPDTFCGNILKGEGEPHAFDIYPENGDWEKARQRLDGLGLSRGAPGIKNLYLGNLEGFRRQHQREPGHLEVCVAGLYLDMQWTGNFPDHTREFAEAWWRPGDLVHYTKEFIDFCVWAQDLWIRETNRMIRGIYFDDCWGAPQVHPDGPVAYRLPDGHVQPGYQFRGFRERFRRTRQVFYDNGVEPQLCAHTTHTFLIPYHSFFDIILDGEDFYSTPPNQGDFIDHWPPDRLRFMNARKWGLITEWLGWTAGGTKTANFPAWTFRQTRAYQANLGVHDIRWDFSDGGFGIRKDDVVFVPYWRDAGLARHEHGPKLKASAWKRPGKCLVLLANLGDERVEAVVQLSPEAMSFAGSKPEQLQAKDVDATLLTYFDYDATNVKKPKMKDDVESVLKEDAEGIPDLEEKPKDLSLADRRAKDPDAKFAWEDGTLRCPVRRHDYRVFLFTGRER